MTSGKELADRYRTCATYADRGRSVLRSGPSGPVLKEIEFWTSHSKGPGGHLFFEVRDASGLGRWALSAVGDRVVYGPPPREATDVATGLAAFAGVTLGLSLLVPALLSGVEILGDLARSLRKAEEVGEARWAHASAGQSAEFWSDPLSQHLRRIRTESLVEVPGVGPLHAVCETELMVYEWS